MRHLRLKSWTTHDSIFAGVRRRTARIGTCEPDLPGGRLLPDYGKPAGAVDAYLVSLYSEYDPHALR